MPDSRELAPAERMKIARRLAELATDARVDPAAVLAQLAIPAAQADRFDLHQAPVQVWSEIVRAVHAGISQRAGAGRDAVARLLDVLGSQHLPGNVELQSMAFDLGNGPVPAAGVQPAAGQVQAVFLSYAHVDQQEVDKLYDELKAQQPKIEVFQDHRMPSGVVWLDAIHGAATRSSKMACWTTLAYLASTFCAFEVGLATSAGASLVPVFVPPALKIGSLPAYLSRFQGIDGDLPLTRIAQAILAPLV